METLQVQPEEALHVQPEEALHVLLVEDDEVTLRTVEQLLRKCNNYQVTSARDGREALRVLKEGRKVDLILTDINMPEMSGLDLIAEVVNGSYLRDNPASAVGLPAWSRPALPSSPATRACRLFLHVAKGIYSARDRRVAAALLSGSTPSRSCRMRRAAAPPHGMHSPSVTPSFAQAASLKTVILASIAAVPLFGTGWG